MEGIPCRKKQTHRNDRVPFQHKTARYKVSIEKAATVTAPVSPVTQCNNSSVACRGQFLDFSYVVEGSFESFYYL